MRKVLSSLILLVILMSLAIPMPVTHAENEIRPVFSVTTAKLKKDIAKYSLSVTVKGSQQRFAFRASEITKITIKSKSYSKKTETVKAVILIDRKVATVRADVTIRYKYTGKSWKLSQVTFTKTSIHSIHLKGKWTGTYIANQGKTRVNIDIRAVTLDGFIRKGTFHFSAVPTNPSVPTGSYTLKGGFDKQTGEVVFAGNEWLIHPSDYIFIEIHAWVDLANRKIVSGSNSWYLDLRKK